MEPDQNADLSTQRRDVFPRWLGGVLIGLGVLVNEWTLGLLAPDGVVTGEGKLWLIVFFQVACVASGVAIVARVLEGGVRRWVAVGAAVGVGAALVSSASWGIRAYTSRHNHTVHAGHEMEATAEQRAWANDFYYRSLEAAKRNGWFDYENAREDGYVKMWKDRAHYQNEEYIFDDVLLDPNRPEFLMYMDQPEGKVLLGFMYFTRTLEEKGPALGGPLARWHFHPWAPRGLCAIEGILPVGRPDDDGRCEQGERVMRSAEMLHVYFVDHPLGRFADGMIFPEEKSLSDPTLYHPFLVHFPIGLFIISVMLDVAGKLFNQPAWHKAAWINLVLAGVAAIATVVTGLVAEVNLLINAEVHETLTTHKQLGFLLLGAIVALIGWRAWNRGSLPARAGGLYLVLAIASAGLTLVTGSYGAELVYVDGVAVQAIDRNALDNHKYRVFNIYRRETSDDDIVIEGGFTGEMETLADPTGGHDSHD